MSLQGKTALITGSAGGLGRTIADHLLSLGANLVICDINAARLSATQAELSVSHPDRTLFLEVNVADEESVKSLIAKSVEEFGQLDIVVNNAAIMDRFDPAGDCDLELWNRVLAVNLTGPFLVTKHAVPHMKSQAQARGGQGGGLIINIGSIASVHGLTAGVAYTASKHAILGLTKNTASFYAKDGVYSIALLLGGMANTNITDAFAENTNQDGFKLMGDTYPGVRMVPTEHVARYVAFLSEGDMGQAANGSCITLNSNWPAA
ncbi:Short chain dehydrogenase/reductase dpchG [Cladobotryum mycophilum]|uniref:Short chain dehydrogenase/reductase dpchG n=1 Tax=Cladobotryum mycophilum TaxID=491253 RepID=A0ABR0S8Z4_9HYPO